MDTIGYLLLLGLGFVAVKLLGGSSPQAALITGTDSATGATIIDSSKFSAGATPGYVPATKQANGSYYCPLPTKLYMDGATGTYRCYNPNDIAKAAAAATTAYSQGPGLGFTQGPTAAQLGAPPDAGAGYVQGPTASQLGINTAPDVGDGTLPTVDLTQLLGGTPGIAANATLPQPAPVAGTDQVLGNGSTATSDPSGFTATGALYT